MVGEGMVGLRRKQRDAVAEGWGVVGYESYAGGILKTDWTVFAIGGFVLGTRARECV